MSTPWTFIGAGNMASSLVGGLINSGTSAQDISVVDINAEALQRLASQFGVNTYSALSEAPDTHCLIIAVKPHIVQTVCNEIKATGSKAMVVSVAAGVREASMQSWLAANTAIVRCMPNTPALLGQGATGLFANEACNDSHKQLARQLLDSAGLSLWVDSEAQLDAVTAVSGSGPAYFFNLIEHMVAAGTQLGLDEKNATELAIQTAFGAASMAKEGSIPPAQLRANVTSKGGTTAAALSVFDQHNFNELVQAAMQAAHDRARELGDEFGATS